MKENEDCIEQETDCICGHIKIEKMSRNEFRIFISEVIKHMVRIKREAQINR